MTTPPLNPNPPPKPTPPEPLTYQTPPPRKPGSIPCLVASILLAIFISLFTGLAILIMTSSNQWQLGVALIVGVLAIIAFSIFAGKKWTGPAVAILIAALCAFFLTLGLCSQFTLNLK